MIASQDQTFSIVDASISDIQALLSAGHSTCVDLVARLLHRISVYDCRGPRLNAIPIINPDVFAEAAASDTRRARGETIGPLDGIPYTAKDSYKVRGLTVASGSPAFQGLVANDDAFTIQKLREAGAVLIGKTNMPPMAAGGMQRGVYGRAESPYNPAYLAAAFASGSSNGSAVATAASFALFGMGEETVSSGRSPASNNALVAYTPSRGAISIRGNWPLYPTCDVVVPHTRTVQDVLSLLDVIAVRDGISTGDFWRHQKWIAVRNPWGPKTKSFSNMISENVSLDGVRIAVPQMYIGGIQLPDLPEVYTHADTIALYQQAKTDLEALGATVIELPSFPLIEHYENPKSAPPGGPRLPAHWHTTERSLLIASAWEEFLRENNDKHISSLSDVQWEDIFPAYPPDDPQVRYSEPTNRVHYQDLARLARKQRSIFDTPDLATALKALEEMRKQYLEDWLDEHKCDCVMFPAAGDVGQAIADVDYEAAEHAWRNGVRYSNGNRALRHCGVPTVTVPMGVMKTKGMPMGLTFAGKGADDLRLLSYAAAYEKAYPRRSTPKHTPTLPTDIIRHSDSAWNRGIGAGLKRGNVPEVVVEKCSRTQVLSEGMTEVQVAGYLTVKEEECTESCSTQPLIDVFIDADQVEPAKLTVRRLEGSMTGRAVFDFHCSTLVPAPPVPSQRDKVSARRKIARESTMVIVLARMGKNGRPAGHLELL